MDLFGDFLIPSPTVFIAGQKNSRIRLDHTAHKEAKIAGIRGTIGVTMATDTIISTLSGDIIDPATIGIFSATAIETAKANAYHTKKIKKSKSKKGKNDTITSSDVFEFGIPGTHLVFSAPVAITIGTPTMSDGNIVDLAVLHENDTTFNTQGLSVTSDTRCGIDGSASKPGSQAIVKNGKITFYTCGASSFTMNPTGGTAGSNDLRIIIGDCGQIQIYYNNLTQIYTGNPATTGCGLPGVWPSLRIGATTYGNGVD